MVPLSIFLFWVGELVFVEIYQRWGQRIAQSLERCEVEHVRADDRVPLLALSC